MSTILRRDQICPPETPVCPVCEGLECVCRPRFFAGQRLTEKELNDLVGYIKSKQRMQNRYLHGWGTVCGLEVSCDPCGNAVRISPGYAIDPCGEDVVVCAPDTVDVCKLIRACCDKEQREQCRPYGATSECEGLEEKWVLAIRYEESQSRGIVPLIARCTTPAGSCQCGSVPCRCGGASAGGCGCGGGAACTCGGQSKAGKGRVVSPPRSAPPQCEPTEICEGYRYEVYRLPEEPDGRRPNPDDRTRNLLEQVFCGLEGPMFERICCCVGPLLDVIPPNPPTLPASGRAQREAAYRWCCQLKLNLSKHIQHHPVFDCDLLARVQAQACPSPDLDDAAFNAAMTALLQTMAIFLVEALIACICSAILPQCPPPAHDARVPLAVVTVTGRDCRVIDICNWTPHRKILLTWQTMSYWFSWLPVFGSLRNGLHALCCSLFGLRQPDRPDSTVPPPGTNVPGAVPVGDAAGPRFAASAYFGERSSFATAALMRMPRLPASMSPADLAQALFTRRGADETVAVSDDDIATVPEFRLLNNLAAPLVSSFGIDGLMAALGPGARDVAGAPAAAEADVAALRQQVQTLQATLRSQAATIDRLARRIDPEG
jgi:hypothetical protein